MNKIYTQPRMLNTKKFSNPNFTAEGKRRAFVPLMKPRTLWFNTGTLCNIKCQNCYIESSPQNDRLIYITVDDVQYYLDQIKQRQWQTSEIGFTGGEPFMNPSFINILDLCLSKGYTVLVLTNAMRPMMRKPVQNSLLRLHKKYCDQLTLRVSLDHFDSKFHDQERGKGSYDITLQGMCWLRDHNFNITVAGRTLWHDTDKESRNGYAALFAKHNFNIDANDPGQMVLFPEMDGNFDVPEISIDCWRILNKSPRDVMCASSRMVIKRKGAKKTSVVACTLLAYEPEFELGQTLQQAEKNIKLNHPHCAKFCVLGGARCSG